MLTLMTVECVNEGMEADGGFPRPLSVNDWDIECARFDWCGVSKKRGQMGSLSKVLRVEHCDWYFDDCIHGCVRMTDENISFVEA